MESPVTVCSPNPKGPKTRALGLSLDSTPTHSMALGQGHCLDPSPHLLRMGAQFQLSHCRRQQEQNQKVDWNILACYKNKVCFVLQIIHDRAIALPRASLEKRSWVGRTHTSMECASHCTAGRRHPQRPGTLRVPWKARIGKDIPTYPAVLWSHTLSPSVHKFMTKSK